MENPFTWTDLHYLLDNYYNLNKPERMLETLIDHGYDSSLKEIKEIIDNYNKNLLDENGTIGFSFPATLLNTIKSIKLCVEPNYKKLAKEVCDKNAKFVNSYVNGKLGVLGFFVGSIMKETNGAANPKLVTEAVKLELESRIKK